MSPLISPGSGGHDRRAELIPPELLSRFSDRFVASCELADRYVLARTAETVERLGLADALATPRPLDEALAACGLDEAIAAVPVGWLLRRLAQDGHAELDRDGRWQCGSLPVREADALRQQQEAIDPTALPTYRIIDAAAAGYPEVLRGRCSGEQWLFSGAQLESWPAYFSNDNPLYAINNLVTAEAVAHWCDQPLRRVLELGAGFGSGAIALLERLEPAGRLADLERYQFSDAAPFFLRRGARAVGARFPGLPLATLPVDAERPLEPQGIEPQSVDLVVAINVLHALSELPGALRQIRDALRPGGWLVLGECLRPKPGAPVGSEFVFNLLEPFRRRAAPPREPGFLTPEAWHQLLGDGGFAERRLYPDLLVLRDVYPGFVVGAIGARRD